MHVVKGPIQLRHVVCSCRFLSSLPYWLDICSARNKALCTWRVHGRAFEVICLNDRMTTTTPMYKNSKKHDEKGLPCRWLGCFLSQWSPVGQVTTLGVEPRRVLLRLLQKGNIEESIAPSRRMQRKNASTGRPKIGVIANTSLQL